MNRPSAMYWRVMFVDRAWIMFHADATAAQIDAAVKSRDLPMPFNENGVLKWRRDEAVSWIEARDAKRVPRMTR